jgi:Xaa-Pro aminopeptidase
MAQPDLRREPRAMNISAQHSGKLAIPFDHHRLDRLMDEADIDLVIATSKHNVQYLLGGHRANFFDYMDATGVTRYLPVFVYPKGAPERPPISATAWRNSSGK